jgi:hypothetical protein
MGEIAAFTIGSEVSCGDGVCGELRCVVIDPVARALTHLVVEAKDGRVGGRLVPIDLVDSTDKEIRLRCAISEFNALEHAEETQFLPATNEEWGYGQGQLLSWPYYGLGMGGMGMGIGAIGLGTMNAGPQAITYDRVPIGEVEVRRGEHVHATDGDIGRVQGLIIDPGDHHVTHVLLDEGHLWGKKEVAIPISAVTGVDSDGVRLNLKKDDVRDLAPVELDHPE